MSTSSITSLLSACDQLEPPRLITRTVGPDEVSLRRLRFPGPFAVVGSHPTVDITLTELGLRPRHYYLQAIGPKVHAIALGRAPLETIVSLKKPKTNLDPPAHVACDRHETSFSFEGRILGPRSDHPRAAGEPEIPGLLTWPVLELKSGGVVGCWRLKRAVFPWSGTLHAAPQG